ncbi:hypothetical protein [Rhodoferax lithotrophicus]|nr:hypothetical protein [Rhodoferax sp. MIZ03]
MKITFDILKNISLIALLTLFQACSTAPEKTTVTTTNTPAVALPDHFFLPPDIFKATAGKTPASTTLATSASESFVSTRFLPTGMTQDSIFKPLLKQVILYASPTNKKFLATGGVDAQINVRVWEIFLRKYKIPFQTITTVEQLEASVPGVLVLPSSVALSKREKQSITRFRALGGSILATWLVGVRDEAGAWQGFDFMENTLDIKVLGDTEKEEEVNFLMTYGGTPIVHSLPAGQRVWLERVKGIYPLHLQSQQASAKILDWSRINGLDQPGHSIVFNEKALPSGTLSRVVAVGYPERLWRSADQKAMEAIAHNSLLWLLRLPDVYLGSWPHPYSNALTVAVDVIDVADDVDLKFFDAMAKAKVHITYFVLSSVAAKSAATLKILQSKGNEIAYLGDRFEGFKGQSSEMQAERLKKLLQEMRDAGFTLPANAGFHAPIESQDASTEKLLTNLGFSYFVSFMDRTDVREPFLPPTTKEVANAATSLIVLPRTITPPEDAMEQNPDNGLKQFLTEFDLSTEAGALSIIRFPNQSLLAPEELDEITTKFANPSKKIWSATAGEVVDWWRERQHLHIDLDTKAGIPRLTVNITGVEPLRHSASVLINLPYPNDSLRLIPDGNDLKDVSITPTDPWRAAVKLENIKPGKYSWLLRFDHAK